MNNGTIKTITKLTKPISKISGKGARNGQRIILTYHGISRSQKFNCVSRDIFKEQLAWLKEKYLVIPLYDLVKNLRSPFLHHDVNLVAITFDDGYLNFVKYALPVLQELNCHASVFVPAGKTGYYNDWDQNFNGFHKMNIMSYGMLRQLPVEFVEIGSHGLSHVPLDRLPTNEIKREIIESRLEIEQNISRPVRFFAFPFGAYPFDRTLRLYDHESHFLGGYQAACTSWWGRYNSLRNINMLFRIGIWDSDSLLDFINKLEGCYDWLGSKEKVGRIIKRYKAFI